MANIVYNYDSLFEKDVNNVVKRAKLIILNSQDEIAICYSHKNYFLLGGHVEEGESDYECLKREIKEEAGIDIDFEIDSPLLTITYYNKDYPKIGMNTKSVANYYVINKDIDVNSDTALLTTDEKSGNFEIRFIKKNEVCNVIRESLKDGANTAVVSDTLKICEIYLNKKSFKLDSDFDLGKIKVLPYNEETKKMNVGDEVIFTSSSESARIASIYVYSSLEDLMKHHNQNCLDYRNLENDDKNYRIIGIEFEK